MDLNKCIDELNDANGRAEWYKRAHTVQAARIEKLEADLMEMHIRNFLLERSLESLNGMKNILLNELNHLKNQGGK